MKSNINTFVMLSAVLIAGCVNEKSQEYSKLTVKEISRSCQENMGNCVLLVIAENATFMEECGKIYPKSKNELNQALANWSVLKLNIPNLKEVALNPNSNIRKELNTAISPYISRIPPYEREIECSGRLAMLKNPQPMLKGDAAKLPDDVLKKYE